MVAWRGLDDGEGLIPALLMLRTCFEREQPLLRKAIALRKRMRSIAKALDRALPDVCCIRYRLPKRTKIFQEIPAYAEIHALMRAWDAFGEFQMQRDGMVLHTWKMDKLYEYYVLYELLSVLRGRGFRLTDHWMLALLSRRTIALTRAIFKMKPRSQRSFAWFVATSESRCITSRLSMATSARSMEFRCIEPR